MGTKTTTTSTIIRPPQLLRKDSSPSVPATSTPTESLLKRPRTGDTIMLSNEHKSAYFLPDDVQLKDTQFTKVTY